MKVFLFVLVATIFEAAGDAIVRVALHQNSAPTRIGLYLVGALSLTLYGTSLNLAPVEFAQVTGIYIATLFVMFQISNYFFFDARPTIPVAVGGTLIVAGGLIVGLFK
jgi:small multidrug resistance family-3 protein